jgi:hypothetical protein
VSSSHVHDTCLNQTDLGYRQAPLMQQHPRVQGSFLLSWGLNLADFVSVSWAIGFPRY